MPTPSTAPAITIVVAYFGSRPLWFPAFLLSCRANPDVRWLIYGDLLPGSELPANVVMKPMDLAGFSRRASEALGASFSFASPYKVCDFKPAYGVMFADNLDGADFWACSDLDIVWGDIRSFLTDALLDKHDIVSSRRKRLSGRFTLFRNDEATNRTFELIPDVRAALAASEYRSLDEPVITAHLQARIDAAPARALAEGPHHRQSVSARARQRSRRSPLVAERQNVRS